MRGLALPLEIRGRGAGHPAHVTDVSRHQRGLEQRTAANHAVDVVADEIRGPIADAALDVDLRILRQERRAAPAA